MPVARLQFSVYALLGGWPVGASATDHAQRSCHGAEIDRFASPDCKLRIWPCTRARVSARACARAGGHVFVCVRVHMRVCVRACSCWISWLFCSSSVAIDSTSFFSANIGCCSTASADGRSCTRTQLQRWVCGVRWDNSRPLVSSTRTRLLARDGRTESVGTIAPGVCVCARACARVCVCVRVCLY